VQLSARPQHLINPLHECAFFAQELAKDPVLKLKSVKPQVDVGMSAIADQDCVSLQLPT